MNGADHEAEVKPALLSAFDLNALKSAGTFLGIIGSGSGGFAALSFGIGYLAIKKHDELIGLPTTLADPTSYIRTGALFFSNSAYFLLAATYKLLVVLALVALLLLLVLLVARKTPLFRSLRARRKTKTPAGSPSRGWLLPTSYILLLALALCALALQTAAFDPQNRNLLYQVIADRQARLEQNPASPPAPVKPKAESVLGWPPRGESLAGRINALLRHPQGRDTLQVFYGQQLAVVLVLIYGVVICRVKRKQWEARMEAAGTPRDRRPYKIVQGLAPFVYLVALVLLLNLPSAYGVLCLPTNAALVRVSVTGAEGDTEAVSGTLLSDLSGGGKEIWLLGGNQDKFVLTVLDRGKVTDITLMGEVTDNFLAIEDPI
jgi:hypothetical protein